MNPYHVAGTPPPEDQPAGVRIVPAMSTVQLVFLILVFPPIAFFMQWWVKDDSITDTMVWGFNATVVLLAIAVWIYWRLRENRLRASPPQHRGKPALWASSARLRRSGITSRNGYLLLTWDALVWVRQLGHDPGEEVVIPLDRMARVKPAKARLDILGSDGVRFRFLVHGGDDWFQLIEMVSHARVRKAEALKKSQSRMSGENPAARTS